MGWIILAIVVILVIAIISMYNGLVSSRVDKKLIMLGAKLMYNYKEDLI